jgi:N-acetylglucosamine malate deacetylase 1
MTKPAHTGVALAVGAHPDDIEFLMAGTLILLRRAGYTTHYLNLASGSCGGSEHSAAALRRIRAGESRKAAGLLGAVHHPSLVDDLQIYYEPRLLRRLAAVIREVQPTVMLVPSPQDYMEDHTNACRLAVTAAFVRGMRNFRTQPMRSPVDGEVTLYHAMPHGLRDPLRRRVTPGSFVDTATVHALQRSALAAHRSQQGWLAQSQKLNAYLATMGSFARQVGQLSGRFQLAEGWRRHLHYGFCAPEADPLEDALGKKYRINRAYEAELDTVTRRRVRPQN